MRIVIEDIPDDLSAELALGILSLVARHQPVATGATAATVLMQSDWTPERAAHLLRDLPARALAILRAVVDGSGWADVGTLRGPQGEETWKGLNATLAKVVNRGARRGLWPDGIRLPLTPTAHPDEERRIRGFAMSSEIVAVFAQALCTVDGETVRPGPAVHTPTRLDPRDR
ncbi:hypothetical protein ABZ605_13470 [Streptomyces sp. NPDC012765]|uniref:hypothetical protein n=1 Tax=Streptomyces sp. NPDC012765 TaxID=3155249 RepID=UPI0033D14371